MASGGRVFEISACEHVIMKRCVYIPLETSHGHVPRNICQMNVFELPCACALGTCGVSSSWGAWRMQLLLRSNASQAMHEHLIAERLFEVEYGCGAKPCVCTVQASPRGITCFWWPCSTPCSGLHQQQVDCIAAYPRTALKSKCLTCACIHHACIQFAFLDHITWQLLLVTAGGSTMPAHTVSDSDSFLLLDELLSLTRVFCFT
jgi:hypothetical protein